MWLEIIGWITTVLAILMYSPQVIMVIITKNTKNLSKGTFTMLLYGCFVWCLYSLGLEDPSWPAYVGNIMIWAMMVVMAFYLFNGTQFFLIALSSTALQALVLILYFSNVEIPSWLLLTSIIIASVTSAIPFVPQIRKIYKSKDASSLSMIMIVLIMTAHSLWIVYWGGRLHGQEDSYEIMCIWISISSSVIALSCQVVLSIFTLRYKHKTLGQALSEEEHLIADEIFNHNNHGE